MHDVRCVTRSHYRPLTNTPKSMIALGRSNDAKFTSFPAGCDACHPFSGKDKPLRPRCLMSQSTLHEPRYALERAGFLVPCQKFYPNLDKGAGEGRNNPQESHNLTPGKYITARRGRGGYSCFACRSCYAIDHAFS